MEIEEKQGRRGPGVYLARKKKDIISKLMRLFRRHIPVKLWYKLRPNLGLSMYLSGGMEFKEELGAPWREWLSNKLQDQGIIAIDPVKLEMPGSDGDKEPIQVKLTRMKNAGDIYNVRKIVRDTLFRKDMLAIQLADAVVVLYDESVQRGAGTLSEAWEAFREGRPVYLVTSFDLDKIPTWLIGETTEIFKDLNEFLDYTKNPHTLTRDIALAKRTKNEVLGDIY